MKKSNTLFLGVIVVLAMLFITACGGGIAGGDTFVPAEGEWAVATEIDFGGGGNNLLSNGQGNIYISEDLERATGTATIPHPAEISQRHYEGLTRIALQSGAQILLQKAFPKLKEYRSTYRGTNVATSTMDDTQNVIEFSIDFSEQDVATTTVYLNGPDGMGSRWTAEQEAVITRDRNQETPNEISFTITLLGQDGGSDTVYEITATK